MQTTKELVIGALYGALAGIIWVVLLWLNREIAF